MLIIFTLTQQHNKQAYDFAQNYDITTINAKKSVLDGIGQVAGIVDNDDLIVDQSCKHTFMALDQYQWDPNPNLMKEKPKHDMASHMAGAIRYAPYTYLKLQPLSVLERPNKKQFLTYDV